MEGIQKDLTVLRGFIMFMPSNMGSKSEGMYPFLYVNCKQIVPAFFFKDNPFTNDTLRKYDGKFVEVKGTQQGSKFTVHEISLIFNDGLEPPAKDDKCL